jgi:catechol 2,3-dioxygenase-like lactoylglutathione lyase family enzyme
VLDHYLAAWLIERSRCFTDSPRQPEQRSALIGGFCSSIVPLQDRDDLIVIPPHDGDGQTHLAFTIPLDSEAAWTRHLRAHEVPIESRVAWPRGGFSLYFRDPDGHLLELVSPGCWTIY